MKISFLKYVLVAGALLSFSLSLAQDVSGNVSDVNGPLPGVSVLEKGTANGTQTNFDGNYTLNDVANDATLVFRYVGYRSVEVPVNGKSSISVTLVEDSKALEEVVIIGYGTTTAKDATGAVTAVTAEDFNAGVIASPEQLIQGKTAGVNIQQTTGEPGAGISINIRGSNSIRSNNNPLIVVDGIPLSGENTAPSGNTGAGETSPRNPLNFLNPNDIESISILKDASATAIYGSRGANGVVIISTKSGKSASGGVFEFSSTLSTATPANAYDLLNREEFLEAVALYGGDRTAVDFGANTNWQDYITRTAVSQSQNLSYSNNYGKGNVRGTFGYTTQNGVVEKTDLERITGRLNWKHKFLEDKLVVGIQTSVSRVNDETAPLSGTAGFRGDILGAAYSANPTWPTNPNFDDGVSQLNPANWLEYSQFRTTTDRVLLNGSLEYKITPELTAKLNVGYDKSEGENLSMLSGNLLNFSGISGVGFGTFNVLERENTLLEATLNWKKDFDNSNIDVLVGYSFQDFRTSGFNAQARGFGTTDLNRMASDLIATVNGAASTIDGSYQQYYYDVNTSSLIVNRLFPDVVAGDSVPFGFERLVQAMTADTFDNTDELQSYFARINYSLANKYLFTGTIRADGSSRFGPNNRYGYFPSGAIAWKISEEDFIGERVSTLKLRLSAGLAGNQEGLGYGNSVARQRFSELFVQNDFMINQNGLAIVSVGNPNLRWEETFGLNIGIDFGFDLDRFSGSIDVYRNETDNLLFQLPAAAPSNRAYQFGNFPGTTLNQGIELALAYDFIQTQDSKLAVNFNIAYNKNELQDFQGFLNAGPGGGSGISYNFIQRFGTGRSLFSYYMAIFQGFDSNGLPTYRDVDGNGVGDPVFDRTFVGEDALPDVTSGLSINYKIKNWDFAACFQGQFGFSVYNLTANGFFTGGAINNARNVTKDLLQLDPLESGGASADISTRFLEKGDFVRFQNATVGYQVPLLSDSFLSALRLSVTGQNVFLITGYSGLDPEVTVDIGDLGNGVPSRGIDKSAFPNPRTITFGVNASF